MTPFMMRVAEFIGATDEEVAEAELSPMPATRISQRIDTGTGADRQVAIRSLAEQLVCEANAIIGPVDEHLTLVDETLPDELAFTIGHRGRAVRVSMTFADGKAFGRLIGDGFESEVPTELADADALPDLLIRLIAESGLPHRPVSA